MVNQKSRLVMEGLAFLELVSLLLKVLELVLVLKVIGVSLTTVDNDAELLGNHEAAVILRAREGLVTLRCISKEGLLPLPDALVLVLAIEELLN